MYLVDTPFNIPAISTCTFQTALFEVISIYISDPDIQERVIVVLGRTTREKLDRSESHRWTRIRPNFRSVN